MNTSMGDTHNLGERFVRGRHLIHADDKESVEVGVRLARMVGHVPSGDCGPSLQIGFYIRAYGRLYSTNPSGARLPKSSFASMESGLSSS